MKSARLLWRRLAALVLAFGLLLGLASPATAQLTLPPVPNHDLLVGMSSHITLPRATGGVGMITYNVEGVGGLPSGLDYAKSTSFP